MTKRRLLGAKGAGHAGRWARTGSGHAGHWAHAGAGRAGARRGAAGRQHGARRVGGRGAGGKHAGQSAAGAAGARQAHGLGAGHTAWALGARLGRAGWPGLCTRCTPLVFQLGIFPEH